VCTPGFDKGLACEASPEITPNYLDIVLKYLMDKKMNCNISQCITENSVSTCDIEEAVMYREDAMIWRGCRMRPSGDANEVMYFDEIFRSKNRRHAGESHIC
jgi:hypothetical protein